ncbi:MAG: hypothetical protein U0987_21150 [Afipia sp.]|nr:hypothetical protein [Afipia sp.]
MSAEQMMRDTNTSPNRDAGHIEPIFDASGTLRRNVLRRLGAARGEQTEGGSVDANAKFTR